MKPPEFEYRRCDTLAEALEVLSDHGDEVTVLAGGQSLVPMMNLRLARPQVLLDVFHLDELAYLRAVPEGVHVGALTTQHRVEAASDASLGGVAVLREAARQVGHLPIRTRGTIGGSLAHADPAAEMPLAAVLLDAEIVLGSAAGTRTVPAKDFFQGLLTTARRDDELLLEIRFPRPPGVATLVEHARRHGDYGLVLVAVAVEIDGERCRSARLALGGVAGVPVRMKQIEDELAGSVLGDDVIRDVAHTVAASLEPPEDQQATSAYRRNLAGALLGSCLRRVRDHSAGASSWQVTA